MNKSMLTDFLWRVLGSFRNAKATFWSLLRIFRQRMGEGAYSLYRIQGALDAQGATLTLLVAGSERIADTYHSFFFGRAGKVERLQKISGLGLEQAARKAITPGDDLLIWEAWPWESISSPQCLALEAWSTAVLLLEQNTIHDFMQTNVSSMILRRIKQYAKNPCQIEISSSAADLEIFYKDFYQPLLQKRHGSNAHSSPLTLMQSFGGTTVKKMLMFLRRDDRRVAGMLLLHDILSSCLTIQEYGVIEEFLDDSKVFQELYAAMNYSALQWAIDHGLKTLSFGGAPTRLNSGVYYYKKQWGAVFLRNREREAVCLRFLSPKVFAILKEFPLLYFAGQKPCALFAFVPAETVDQSRDELTKLLNAYACRQLQSVTILVPKESLPEMQSLGHDFFPNSETSLSFVAADSLLSASIAGS